MATYRCICSVESASGSQSWLVNASSEKEAREKFKRGEDYVFELDEVEVTDLGDPEIEQIDEKDIDIANYVSDRDHMINARGVLLEVRKLCRVTGNAASKAKALKRIGDRIDAYLNEVKGADDGSDKNTGATD